MSYATLDEIKASAQDLGELITASNGQIQSWADESMVIINTFCNMDFTLETDAIKTFRVIDGMIYLTKPISGTIVLSEDGVITDPYFYSVDPSGLQIEYNTCQIAPSTFNIYRNRTVTIEADWGYSVIPLPIKIVFFRLIRRLAIRSDNEDYVNINGGYTSETTGNDYSWNIGNGTVRNLLRPEDFTLLWPFINNGVIID